MTSTLRRGQTLVMMALTCLLLTMMIMMTISIGSKIKEKMELQTMADAAAYSNAVATARTFNAVSMMNRVGIAHVTGVLAIQSLVSWATFYHSTLYLAGRHYNFFSIQFQILRAACCIPFSPCGGLCACANQGIAETRFVRGRLRLEYTAFEAIFRALDVQAAFEAVAYLTSCDFLHYIGQLPVLYTLDNFINNQSGANRLTNTSRAGTKYNELRVDGQPDRINRDEVGLPWGFGIPPAGALIAINPLYSHHAFAAMGSRLHPFITGRTGILGPSSLLIQARLALLVPPAIGVSAVLGLGSGYVSLLPGPQHGANPITAMFSRFMSADDHGLLTTFYVGALPCPIIRLAISAPRAMLFAGQTGGLHTGNNWVDSFHWLGGLFRNYPWFMDYHFVHVDDEGDIWAQPKNFGVVRRDYSVRPTGASDPYNPLFRFGFSAGGSGLNLAKNTGPDSQQVAVGTGVTYYHRGNNLLGYHSGVEPPNFFNPFWRAGLSRVNVDNNGLGDFSTTFGGSPAGDSFNGLRSGGFRGWQ